MSLIWLNTSALSNPHSLFVSLTSPLILGQDHLNKILFWALIDSGSTHRFVDSEFVDTHHLKTFTTPSVALHLFDGSSNSTISEIANLPIMFSTSDCMNLDFYVLLSIFAGKSCSFLCHGQHTIGISILFGHLSAIIGLCGFYICIQDLHV